jgi:hypothetical protein
MLSKGTCEYSTILQKYKVCPGLSSYAKVMVVLLKVSESGFLERQNKDNVWKLEVVARV